MSFIKLFLSLSHIYLQILPLQKFCTLVHPHFRNEENEPEDFSSKFLSSLAAVFWHLTQGFVLDVVMLFSTQENKPNVTWN
jgi:hypothetical protein